MAVPVRKHIALISVYGDSGVEIPLEEAGGQNIYIQQVGEALARQGWEVDIFARKVDPNQADIVEHSPNCRTIRLKAGPEKHISRDWIFGYLPAFTNAMLDFQKQTGIYYPIVHTNYWLSGWVGLKLKKIQSSLKLIHTYHSLATAKYEPIERFAYVANTRLNVEKACLKAADYIVASSPQEQEDIVSLAYSYENIKVIPSGAQMKRFTSISRQTARQELGISTQARVIVLYVRSFEKPQEIERFLKAVNISKMHGHENIKLIIVGANHSSWSNAPEGFPIQGMINQLGMSDYTTFLHPISYPQLPIYCAAADLCIVPIGGSVAIEAMASATPVIIRSLGGLEFKVVSEETGLLDPVQDEFAVANTIDRILDNPEWQKQLGDTARKRVEEHFSWERVASQLSELYIQQLQKPSLSLTSNHSGLLKNWLGHVITTRAALKAKTNKN